jgi:integrase
VAVYKQKKSKYWSYKFTWNGKQIRKSTKQTNKVVARQMEAAHRTALAKGEVGIFEKKVPLAFKEFAEHHFVPYVKTHFAQKPRTIAYYISGIGHLLDFAPLANAPLDRITVSEIAAFVEKDRNAEFEVATINRHLQILRRMLNLAVEWGKLSTAPPRISLLPGERMRDRVLTSDEESAFLAAAARIGDEIIESYNRARNGIRAMRRGQTPKAPTDPYLLRDVAVILLDCGLRPEECYRLQWDHIRDGAVHIPFGKTANARRSIPLSPRAAAILEMRRPVQQNEWVFPASTKSGHIEQSTLKKRHARACKLAQINEFPPYTFRHTCLTRWAAHMDPYTLAYLAGHRDFGTTKRYVHPQTETVLAAMERVRTGSSGHTSWHTGQERDDQGAGVADYKELKGKDLDGTPEWIRTTDLLLRRQTLYPAELRAHVLLKQL